MISYFCVCEAVRCPMSQLSVFVYRVCERVVVASGVCAARVCSLFKLLNILVPSNKVLLLRRLCQL